MRRQDRQERAHVEEVRLIRMVLDAEQVVAETVGEAGELDELLRLSGGGGQEESKQEVVGVVSHVLTYQK